MPNDNETLVPDERSRRPDKADLSDQANTPGKLKHVERPGLLARLFHWGHTPWTTATMHHSNRRITTTAEIRRVRRDE